MVARLQEVDDDDEDDVGCDSWPDLICPVLTTPDARIWPSFAPSARGAGRLGLGRFNLTGKNDDVCSLGVGMARVVG